MSRKPAREPPLAGGTQADALAAELAALGGMDAAALRAQWQRLHRTQPPPKLGRDLLELAVAWAVQERVLGGLDAGSRRQLASLAGALASGADLPKARRVSLRPGARLVRQWGGQTHEVVVVEGGFLWRDRIWPSLSVIAREMTGARWSGPRFFGLDRAGAPSRGRATTTGADADA